MQYFTKKNYPLDTKNRIVQEVLQTKDYREVARTHKIPEATVYNWIVKAGHSPKTFNTNVRERENPTTFYDTQLSTLKKQNEVLFAQYMKVEDKLAKINQIINDPPS